MRMNMAMPWKIFISTALKYYFEVWYYEVFMASEGPGNSGFD